MSSIDFYNPQQPPAAKPIAVRSVPEQLPPEKGPNPHRIYKEWRRIYRFVQDSGIIRPGVPVVDQDILTLSSFLAKTLGRQYSPDKIFAYLSVTWKHRTFTPEELEQSCWPLSGCLPYFKVSAPETINAHKPHWAGLLIQKISWDKTTPKIRGICTALVFSGPQSGKTVQLNLSMAQLDYLKRRALHSQNRRQSLMYVSHAHELVGFFILGYIEDRCRNWYVPDNYVQYNRRLHRQRYSPDRDCPREWDRPCYLCPETWKTCLLAVRAE